MIAYLLDWAHKSTKLHLKTSEMGEYLSNKLKVFYPKMFEECERFYKDWESWNFFKRLRKEKVSLSILDQIHDSKITKQIL